MNSVSQRRQIPNTIQWHSHVNFKKPNKLAKGQRGDERSKPRYTLLTTENKLINTKGRWGRWGIRAWGYWRAPVTSTRRCIQGLNHYVVNLKLYHTVFTNRNSSKTLK